MKSGFDELAGKFAELGGTGGGRIDKHRAAIEFLAAPAFIHLGIYKDVHARSPLHSLRKICFKLPLLYKTAFRQWKASA
jgi:hypothetical protein